MKGGAGHDSYRVDNVGDDVVEEAGAGTDTVLSTISYVLPVHVENLQLSGSAVRGDGNALDNKITGNGLGNKLMGGGGRDVLAGGAGIDVLTGGAGDDT